MLSYPNHRYLTLVLGEQEIVKGGVVEEVMRRRNKGKRAMEFGRDFGEAEDGYDEEEEGDEEIEEEQEEEDEQEGILKNQQTLDRDCDVGDASAEDLEGIQMNWCPWKGVTEFDFFSDDSEGSEED